MVQLGPNVVCALSDADFQSRLKLLRARVWPKIVEAIELENGYRLTFSGPSAFQTEVAQFVELEKQCCPSLTFRYRNSSRSDRFLVDITGPEGVKRLLKELFVSSSGKPLPLVDAGDAR